LRQAAQLLAPGDIAKDEVQRLIRDMKETMQDARASGWRSAGRHLAPACRDCRSRRLLEKCAGAGTGAKKAAAVPFHVLINPRIVTMARRRPSFLKAASVCWIFRHGARGAQRPRGISRREGRAAKGRCLGLVCPYSSARNRSPVGNLTSIACAAEHSLPWKLEQVLEG